MVDALIPKGDEGRGVSAISLGEVASNLRSGDFRMGKPNLANPGYPGLASGSIPAEVKHLSKRRKREKFYSLSSGERRGNSPNQFMFIIYWGCKVETSEFDSGEFTKCDLSS